MTILLNFVRERTRESCTRLCALLCCLTACAIGLSAAAFAFAHPHDTASVAALGGVASTFVVGGMVAIINRQKKGNLDDVARAGSAALQAITGGAA